MTDCLMYGYGNFLVNKYLCVCARARVCARMCVCVRVCVLGRTPAPARLWIQFYNAFTESVVGWIIGFDLVWAKKEQSRLCILLNRVQTNLTSTLFKQ